MATLSSDARTEAERRWPTGHVHIPGPLGATTYPAENPRADGFVAGAQWQSSRNAVSLDDHLQAIRQSEAEALHSPAFEAGYQAVYDSGALTGDVYRNAAIWRAVMAALKAAIPAHDDRIARALAVGDNWDWASDEGVKYSLEAMRYVHAHMYLEMRAILSEETCARCGEPIAVRMDAWVHVQSDGTTRVFCAGGELYGEMAQPADRPTPEETGR